MKLKSAKFVDKQENSVSVQLEFIIYVLKYTSNGKVQCQGVFKFQYNDYNEF